MVVRRGRGGSGRKFSVKSCDQRPGSDVDHIRPRRLGGITADACSVVGCRPGPDSATGRVAAAVAGHASWPPRPPEIPTSRYAYRPWFGSERGEFSSMPGSLWAVPARCRRSDHLARRSRVARCCAITEGHGADASCRACRALMSRLCTGSSGPSRGQFQARFIGVLNCFSGESGWHTSTTKPRHSTEWGSCRETLMRVSIFFRGRGIDEVSRAGLVSMIEFHLSPLSE